MYENWKKERISSAFFRCLSFSISFRGKWEYTHKYCTAPFSLGSTKQWYLIIMNWLWIFAHIIISHASLTKMGKTFEHQWRFTLFSTVTNKTIRISLTAIKTHNSIQFYTTVVRFVSFRFLSKCNNFVHITRFYHLVEIFDLFFLWL